jgi:hypothetical protein
MTAADCDRKVVLGVPAARSQPSTRSWSPPSLARGPARLGSALASTGSRLESAAVLRFASPVFALRRLLVPRSVLRRWNRSSSGRLAVGSRTGPKRGPAPLVATVLALSVIATAGGCTKKEVPPPTVPATTPSTSPAVKPVPSSAISVSLDAPGLSTAGTAALRQEVGAIVDRWLEAAYLSGPVGAHPGAERFPGFTPGAARSAARHPGELTNAALGAKAQGLSPTARTVKASAYVSGHRAEGVVAAMAMTAVSPRARLTVRGSLSLTRARGKWRIFGYHVQTATR